LDQILSFLPFSDKRRNTVSIIGFNKLNEKSLSNCELHRPGIAAADAKKMSKGEIDGWNQIGEINF
jgi:hypothetical protein